MSAKSKTPPPIAIVGISALFPGSNSTDGFWRDIIDGRDLISGVPKEHWLVEDYYDPDPKAPDKTYANRGAFLDPIDFDALGWGIPPSIVPATDTAQLLALIVAERVLADASRAHAVDKSRTSVILGVTSAQELLGSMVSRLQAPVWRKSLREMGLPESQVKEACERIAAHYTPWQEATFPGVLGNVVAGRIANRLDLGGTNCVTDAACASTFSALSMAVNELALGQSDLAIAGGVDTMNDIFMFMCFSKTPALSPTGDCRPFSAEGDGTMLGEGLAMFALARLDDAIAQGHRIYGVIRGVGGGSDGRAKSVYAPLADGQARTLRRAYKAAGYSTSTVELLEAHGTGTRAGDAAEFSGLSQVFGEREEGTEPWCALGSVKSQVGHTKAAAGAAGLFKILMSLNEGVIPPSLKIKKPNPKLNLESSPFHLSTRTLPWVRGSDHPRRASVSAFGFGGSNFHIAVEESPKPVPRRNTLPTEILAIDGDSKENLISALETLQKDYTPERFLYLARASHKTYATRPFRAIFVCKAEDLLERIKTAVNHLRTKGTEALSLPAQGIFVASNESSKDISGGLAFVFPGQGSQYIDMGADLAVRFRDARSVWDRTSDITLKNGPLHRVVFPVAAFDDKTRAAQKAKLTQTEWAQPALGVTSLSVLALLKKVGVHPNAVAGHSFGELSALACAEALNETQLVEVARRRGELMALAAEQPGAMSAVSASIEQVRDILNTHKVEAEVANHNAPKQVVIAGTIPQIEAAETAFAQANIRTTRLPVATAFHSSVVANAKEPFGQALANVSFDTPKIPVYSNVSATPHSADTQSIRQSLTEQLASPVRFVEMIQNMYQNGIRTFVEVGPGSVLTSLVSRILEGQPHRAIATDKKGRAGYGSFSLALAELASQGVSIHFNQLFEEYEDIDDPAARPKPKLALPISGANQGKPYPPKEGAAGRPPPNPEREDKVVVPPVSRPQVPAPPPLKTPPAPAAQPRPMAAAPSVKPQTVAQTRVKPTPQASPAPSPTRTPTTPSSTPYVSRTVYTSGTHSSGVKPPSAQPQALTRSTPGSSLDRARNLSSAAKYSTENPNMSNPKKPSNAPNSAWLAAWQTAQVATAQAQSTYQKAMAESQAAYLRMAEASIETLGRLSAQASQSAPSTSSAVPAFGYVPPAQPELPSAAILAKANGNGNGNGGDRPFPNGNGSNGNGRAYHAAVPAPISTPAPVVAAPAAPPIVEPTAVPPPPAPAAPKPAPVQAQAPQVKAVETIKNPASPPPASPQRTSVDLEAKLRSVVAEATGYPEDVLQPSMSLEADLGIDSIKRVEILSMVKKAVPELPELDAGTLGALETLQDVASHLKEAMGSSTESPTPSPSSHVSTPAAAAPAASSVVDTSAIQAKLRTVVAEATGYPEDVLQESMSLEADLGIDSIKRVEILSMVKKAVPALPELDAATLGALETLGDVAQHLVESLGGNGGGGVDASPPPSTAPSSPAPDFTDLDAKLKTVVAEATGYPEDVLQEDMSLEADLGIDSIKRVEILSMVKKAVPALPELDAATLGALETLGDVAQHLKVALQGETSSPSASSRTAAQTTTAVRGPHRFVASWVPSPATSMARIRPDQLRSIAVVGGPLDLQNEIVQTLNAHGFTARASETPSATDDGLILLTGLEEARTGAESVHLLRRAFHNLRAAQGVLQGSGRSLLVSIQDPGQAKDTPERWPLSGLAALVKTAQLEAPSCVAFSMEVASRHLEPKHIAHQLLAELLRGGLEREIRFTVDGQRWTTAALPQTAASEPLNLQAKDVVVVSGGGRGVTAQCLIRLAQEQSLRFVLLGRTPLVDEPAGCEAAQSEADLKKTLISTARARGEALAPAEIGRTAQRILAGREIRATIQALQAAGSEAVYMAADVSNHQAVSDALASIRTNWGPISGIIHAAGVIQDKRILEKTDEQWDRVVSTKLGGLLALTEATQNDPLKVCLLFSSVAGFGGNIGQSDYATANAALDEFAARISAARPGIIAKSLAWGPWRGGMVSSALEAHFEAAGVPLIELSDGAQWMLDELRTPGSVRVVLGGEPKHGALGAAVQTSDQLEIVIDAQSYPELVDHSISGPPVVPVVMISEWMLGALASILPGAPYLALEDLRVRRGIMLETWPEPTYLTVTIQPTQGSEFNLSIVDSEGKERYAAVGRQLTEMPTGPSAPVGLPTASSPQPYGGVLFHGPRFQALNPLKHLGSAGAQGELTDADGLGWTPAIRKSDPVRLDGALQLAVLVTEQIIKGASLPTRIGRLAVALHNRAPGLGQAWSITREQSSDQAVHDAVIEDGAGQIAAVLEGVETTRRPNWTPSA